jgi:Co/Zn/Cd efflux system component
MSRSPRILCSLTRDADASHILHEAEHELREHFNIGHVTLQLEPASFAAECALRSGVGCN